MFRRLIRLFAAVLAPALLAAEADLVITADTTIGDLQRDGQATWQGRAMVRGTNLLLTADTILYNQKDTTLTASGHVVFSHDGARLLADRLVFRRSDGHFFAENIRIGLPPYFAEGASAEGDRKEITIRAARISYGEPGPWEPMVTADLLTIAPGRSVRTEKAAAGIGRVQPLTIPGYQHSLGKAFPVTVGFDGGFRHSLGAFTEARLLTPLSPSLRLGADVGLYSSRGIMIGPAASYESADDPDNFHGYFRSGYINDHGDKKTDVLGQPIGEDRAYAEWQHRQRIGEHLTLSAQLNWWKDSDILRDFRPRAFFPVQEPDTFVESVYTGANYFASVFARFQPNRYQTVQERLPELRFDLLPAALGNGFYHRLNASVAVLQERIPLKTYAETYTLTLRGQPASFVSTYSLGGHTLRTTRLDGYYGIERPIAFTDYFALTPVTGVRLTHYSRTPRMLTITFPSFPPQYWSTVYDKGSFTRPLGELGFDAVLRSSGTFEYQNPQWKINGLRHLLTPRLSYRYIPKGDLGRPWLPPIDRETFATYLPPLGLGDIRSLDDLRATNTLRLGLDNTLQTRDAQSGSRDLLVFNLASDLHFRRKPGEHDSSEIHAELAATPASWLRLDVYQSLAPWNFTLREFNAGLTLHDARAWSLRLGNNFLRGDIQDYSLDARRRLNERLEAICRLHYDSRRHRFNEQTYGLAQTFGNTWLVTYAVSVYSGRKRESNFGFNVRVDTLRF